MSVSPQALAPQCPTKLLLLPSARLLPLELQTEFGPIPTAMVPLGGRPAYLHIAEPYLRRGYQALVAVGERGSVVREHLERSAAPGISVIDVGRTPSLGETIRQALNSLAVLPLELVVNFADTFLEADLGAGDVVCAARPRDLHRWTCFGLDASGHFGEIQEKNRPKPAGDELRTFVGVFQFTEPARFLAALQAACDAETRIAEDDNADTQTAELDPFYRALADYYKASPPLLQEVDTWLDLGHLDTYYRAKQTYWVNARLFNNVAIDPSRGVVRKSSRDTEKFIKEINWYLRLPKNLQHMAPRLLDYSLNPTDAFAEMEFYGYPALNDMYLLGDYDLGLWVRVLDAIEDALRRMHAHRLLPDGGTEPGSAPGAGTDAETMLAALTEMYEAKTRQRLLEALKRPHLAPFLVAEVAINGRSCLGVPRVLEMLPEVIGQAGLYELEPFTVVHGDLCLSNMLFDPRNCFIRVIDPRGSFGSFDIYGDPRYDLAKLSHSFEGDYDFFVNDLFDLSWAGERLTFRANLAPRHKRVRELFRGWLRSRWGALYPQIKLIEALLFLSMVPLHADRPRAQQAFLGRGLELFTQVAAFQGTRGAGADDFPPPLGHTNNQSTVRRLPQAPLETPPPVAPPEAAGLIFSRA